MLTCGGTVLAPGGRGLRSPLFPVVNPARRTRDLVRQLQALGHQVTLEPATA
ncbi:hypothetical protein [Streptomyces sp. NPDC056190]|uniref:hypothetical protein n=1 Tax=unclassified Streptomyces TaxID=2593676 RepID=UPI0035D614C9